MINPIQIFSMINGGGDPKQIINQMLSGNPQFQRVMQMVDGKTPKEMEQVARNLCEQRGMDFNQAVNQMRQMGLKIPKDIE